MAVVVVILTTCTEITDSTGGTSEPAAPTSLSAEAASANAIDLIWSDASDNETGFEIDRSLDGSTWAVLDTAAADLEAYQDTALDPAMTHHYRLRACNDVGCSDYAAAVSATTDDVPPASPTELSARAASASAIDLSWTDASANETGFEIDRSLAGSTWAVIDTAAADLEAYQDTGLDPAMTYHYRLRACNDVGCSDYAAADSATTDDLAPVAPTDLAATAASASAIDLMWTDASGNETGFEIDRSLDGSTWAVIDTAAADLEAYQDTGLDPATTYHYRLRACNDVGCSNYTDAVSGTTDSPPATLSLAHTIPDTLIAWDTVFVTVSLDDANGPVSGETVEFRVLQGWGALQGQGSNWQGSDWTGTTYMGTDLDGNATVSWKVGPIPGTQRLLVEFPGGDSLQLSIEAVGTPEYFHAPGELTVGADYACALDGTGQTYCWIPQPTLHYHTSTTSITPSMTAGPTDFTTVTVGEGPIQSNYGLACGIDPSGTGYCWGKNTDGRLGDGTNDDSTVPVAVTGGHTFAKIAISESTNETEHACGITPDSVAYCWGGNTFGELGDGTTESKNQPTLVSGDLKFVDIAAGDGHSCALDATGSAYCWGENEEGQIGDGSRLPRYSPAQVTGAILFTSIHAGNDHTCGLTETGAAYCWGANGQGQLGDGTVSLRREPIPVATSVSFVELDVGPATSCGLTSGGEAYCWGWNIYGQVDPQSGESVTVPTKISGPVFKSIRVGAWQLCGRDTNDQILCWGFAESGSVQEPVPVVVDVSYP